jgi:hypothetical protein
VKSDSAPVPPLEYSEFVVAATWVNVEGFDSASVSFVVEVIPSEVGSASVSSFVGVMPSEVGVGSDSASVSSFVAAMSFDLFVGSDSASVSSFVEVMPFEVGVGSDSASILPLVVAVASARGGAGLPWAGASEVPEQRPASLPRYPPRAGWVGSSLTACSGRVSLTARRWRLPSHGLVRGSGGHLLVPGLHLLVAMGSTPFSGHGPLAVF